MATAWTTLRSPSSPALNTATQRPIASASASASGATSKPTSTGRPCASIQRWPRMISMPVDQAMMPTVAPTRVCHSRRRSRGSWIMRIRKREIASAVSAT